MADVRTDDSLGSTAVRVAAQGAATGLVQVLQLEHPPVAGPASEG